MRFKLDPQKKRVSRTSSSLLAWSDQSLGKADWKACFGDPESGCDFWKCLSAVFCLSPIWAVYTTKKTQAQHTYFWFPGRAKTSYLSVYRRVQPEGWGYGLSFGEAPALNITNQVVTWCKEVIHIPSKRSFQPGAKHGFWWPLSGWFELLCFCRKNESKLVSLITCRLKESCFTAICQCKNEQELHVWL